MSKAESKAGMAEANTSWARVAVGSAVRDEARMVGSWKITGNCHMESGYRILVWENFFENLKLDHIHTAHFLKIILASLWRMDFGEPKWSGGGEIKWEAAAEAKQVILVTLFWDMGNSTGQK